MYKKTIATKTSIKHNTSVEGERIEKHVQRLLTNKEPIQASAPLTYQERAEGINPDYDIRTDRFEQAVTAMDIATKGRLAKRKGPERPRDETPAAKAAGNDRKDGGKPEGEA